MPLIQHRLKRADGAGAKGTRAGIAVHARHAEPLERPPVQNGLRREKALQICICQQSPEDLHNLPNVFSQADALPADIQISVPRFRNTAGTHFDVDCPIHNTPGRHFPCAYPSPMHSIQIFAAFTKITSASPDAAP